MISNIIVTDDATESSEKAIAKAVEIAKQLNAHLTLIHVINNIEIPASLILGNDRVLIENSRSKIGRALEKGWNKRSKDLIEKLNNDKDIIGIDSKCLTGNAAEKILEFANTNKTDIIVMGASHRLKGISKIKALGSVTRKVSELANCPVLVVH
ncbi:MAG TPA: universal stress protein [Candidatus Nitrosocosmicus sp.]|nr:universal stress protein [Candidatus Nitrosocosmicus sp.]